MFRDDAAARTARASALIDEIAELEREKLARATHEQRDAERLDTAKRELAALHAGDATEPPATEPAPKPAGVLAHAAVFLAAAGAAYLSYVLLVR